VAVAALRLELLATAAALLACLTAVVHALPNTALSVPVYRSTTSLHDVDAVTVPSAC
jgi:hypothetical protein